MALVPSLPNSSAMMQGGVAGLMAQLNSLRSSLADRQALDADIASRDAAEWVNLRSNSVSSSTKPLLLTSAKGSRSSGGRSKWKSRANKQDLSIRPPSNKIPNSVPRNVPNMPVFDTVTIRNTATVTGPFQENGLAWNFNAHPQFANWSGLFDQWGIVQVDVTYMNPQGFGSALPNIELHTAIDFDGVGNLGSIQAIENFDTHRVDVLGPGQKSFIVRSVRPCLKVQTTQSNTGTLGRTWCDSTSPTTAWYGMRSTAVIPTGTTVTLVEDQCITFCFRGRI